MPSPQTIEPASVGWPIIFGFIDKGGLSCAARPLSDQIHKSSPLPQPEIIILSEGAAESKDLRLPLPLPALLFVISHRSGKIRFSKPHSLSGDR